MRHAIEQIRQLIRYYENQKQEYFEFFEDQGIEGKEYIESIYAGLLGELYEAIQVLRTHQQSLIITKDYGR
jgi:hypothetical protein